MSRTSRALPCEYDPVQACSFGQPVRSSSYSGRETGYAVHRGHSPDHRRDKLHRSFTRWAEINVDGLPCTGAITDGEFQANSIDFIHVQWLAFQLKGKIVESQRHGILKSRQPLLSLATDADVNVRCRAPPPQRATPKPRRLSDRSHPKFPLRLLAPIPRREPDRNPAAETLLSQPLFLGSSRQRLFETFNELRTHALCPFCVCWVRARLRCS